MLQGGRIREYKSNNHEINEVALMSGCIKLEHGQTRKCQTNERAVKHMGFEENVKLERRKAREEKPFLVT
jgi:hypothetical protein